MSVIVASVVLALVGLAGAAFFFGRNGARAGRLGKQFAALHRLLSGKYFIDELYDRVLGRPLYWISNTIFLRLGDRVILDGSLNGLARYAQVTAGRLGRAQTGNLQLYILFVLLGVIGVLAWSTGHG